MTRARSDVILRNSSASVVVAATWVMLAFIVTSCGPLRPKSDAWNPDIGAGLLESFQPGFIPPSQFYFAYAAPSRPGPIYVSPSQRSADSVSYSWAPTGHPMGRYVFEIEPSAKTIDHVSWAAFMSLDIESGYLRRKELGDFSSVHPRGTLEVWRSVYPFGEGATRWLAVLSFDDTITARREVGLPSVIPFMGRQKVVERVEYHSGTAYLEIFDLREPAPAPAPAGPVFRMSKVYESWRSLPELDELGGWVMGSDADTPTLAVVDVDPLRPHEIVLVSLPAS